MDTVNITIEDLDDVRQTLAACLRYFQAHDLQNAQVAYAASRQSPLTAEIERVHTRFQGYISDYLLTRHEAELDEDDLDYQEDVEEAEETSEPGEEVFAEAEPLSAAPLGEFKPPRQKGRRLSAEELAASNEGMPEAEGE